MHLEKAQKTDKAQISYLIFLLFHPPLGDGSLSENVYPCLIICISLLFFWLIFQKWNGEASLARWGHILIVPSMEERGAEPRVPNNGEDKENQEVRRKCYINIKKSFKIKFSKYFAWSRKNSGTGCLRNYRKSIL